MILCHNLQGLTHHPMKASVLAPNVYILKNGDAYIFLVI